VSTRSSWRWVAGVGIALSAVFTSQAVPELNSVLPLVIGLGTAAAQVLGIRLNRPPHPLPWVLISMSSFLFVVGIVVRGLIGQRSDASSLLGDVFTISGYLCLIGALALMLRARGGLERHAVTDGVIVCLGAGLILTEFFALPAARVGDRPEMVSLLAGVYPIWDVVLLLLLLNLSFSTAVQLASFRLLAWGMVGLFVGDLCYAWIGATGRLTGPALLDLPFLLGFTAYAAAAVHPSMARLTSTVARRVQAWSFPRLLLIVPALLTPAVVVLARPRLSDVDRVVLALTTIALLVALLLRALTAVRSQAQVQRGLRHQATHDALTGLPNRALVRERLDGMLTGRQGPDVWVLFVDLDGFTLINDHWGHGTGDAVLVEIARRLGSGSRPGQIVARTGGDEFVVAGVGGQVVASATTRQVLAALADPVVTEGIELVVTCSIGIAVATDGVSAEGLLRDADLAMYRAKNEGRNGWRVFDTDMRRTVRERVETEVALRRALARHQLWVAFQPIVECRSGRVVAAEALVRWTHPTRGPIPPVEFIGVAEETGLIDEIGGFVLEQSLSQLAAWRAEGILPDGFHVSVNASARQLRDHGLVYAADEALQRHGLTGDRLVLEITESIMMGDTDVVESVLRAFRDLGIGLSVDDFGTGYSSLSYLSRFPVSTVKIDRAFVSGLGVDGGDEAIVRAVVAMARALDLQTIAEGVETEAQRLKLAALGVPCAQGWLWAKAQDTATFADRHLRGAMVQAGRGNS
jgi:diguanylate cyclase (GGDEF)-like protein